MGDHWRLMENSNLELTIAEVSGYLLAASRPTDKERQFALGRMDKMVRTRLKLPENRYFTVTEGGKVLLDTHRTRPKEVHKISKSDQPTESKRVLGSGSPRVEAHVQPRQS